MNRTNWGTNEKMSGIWRLFDAGTSNYFFITLFLLLLTINKKNATFEHNSISLVVQILVLLANSKLNLRYPMNLVDWIIL